MRTSAVFFSFMMLVCAVIHAQNYMIDFAGTGASSSVDSVKVENLTQCKSVMITGGDVLHLLAQVGINEMDNNGNTLQIYPNPASGTCTAEISTTASDDASIGLYDISGRMIFEMKQFLGTGDHLLKISGLGPGVYVLRIISASCSVNAKILSIAQNEEMIEINMTEPDQYTMASKISANKTSDKTVVEMQYNAGDLLKLTGKSGIYRTVFMLVPASSQTVTFAFVPCTDADGNNYAVVKIGNQWWMAENLNAGIYAPVTTPQLSGTKFCMDVNGQPDPSCPMGGLYEWANLMQGTAACNGSGAPPDDICTTPVQGMCPSGWHIPSHYEWTTLEKNAGSNPSAFPYDESTVSLLGTDEGGNLKETCTSYWWSPNAGATDLLGFGGLPGGDTWQGVFEDYGQSGYYWTSSETLFMAWVHALNYSLSVTGRSYYAVESGFSCRCVKD